MSFGNMIHCEALAVHRTPSFANYFFLRLQTGTDCIQSQKELLQKVTKIIIFEKKKKKYKGSELLPLHNSIDIKITLARPQSYFVELLLTRSFISKYFLYFRFEERYQLTPNFSPFAFAKIPKLWF